MNQSDKSDGDSGLFDNAAIAARLRLLRRMIGGEGRGSQARFIRYLGIAGPRWNNFESGYPLSKEIAGMLVLAIPGVTMDWIYFGRDDKLSLDVSRKLRALAKSTTEGLPPPARLAEEVMDDATALNAAESLMTKTTLRA
jgi:hypothetical protein